MAGATVLASRAAARSGVGMVRLVVSEASLAAVQSAVVEATAITWPLSDDDLQRGIISYAHAVLIGPGLGTSDEARDALERVLAAWQGPVVLDADALNLFAGDLPALAARLRGRPAVITPHVVEMARLTGTSAEAVERSRFEMGRDVARALEATVLLKGVPTVVTAPNGETLVTATGTPVLATAGSGDVLSGTVVTLLAQTGDPLVAGACAAWTHGMAAEIASRGRSWRGVTLDDVVHRLGIAWQQMVPSEIPPVLTWLPALRDAAGTAAIETQTPGR
jgi:NAD(P)H-hydrate epimerase